MRVSKENEITFDKVDKPHDCLIKWSFSRQVVAAGHCRAYCPEAFLSVVDFDNLTSEPSSFVDPELSESHTDLLFKAPLFEQSEGDESIYFYFLIEHITNPKADTVLRLAEYKLDIWRKLCSQAPKGAKFKLPIVLSFIMHQGSEWTMPTRIR